MEKRLRGHAWLRLRRLILMNDPLCVMCGAEGRAQAADEVDHIIALANGGTNEADNLQPLCREHHRIKTASDLGYVLKPEIGLDGWPSRIDNCGRGGEKV
jgi:5-methylcytosine-specific restriction endonuclease McrA